MSNWRPSCSLESIYIRAQLLTKARAFFAERKIIEVETPLLGTHSVTEPNIDSFALQANGVRYLQTSPEYAMKRLLAAGVGDIYQICKSFRQQESGTTHNPEFTLVEWYRLGFSMHQIMQETVEFVATMLVDGEITYEVNYVSYSDASQQIFGTPLANMSQDQLSQLASAHGLVAVEAHSIDQLCDFIFSNCVVPAFDSDSITVVFHYPASQASLAKLEPDNTSLAQRFEIFVGGLELANGFVELTDANEQFARFANDQHIRSCRRLSAMDIDQQFMSALQHGLPDCAGVAVGFDRLLMLSTGASTISEVISFDWESV